MNIYGKHFDVYSAVFQLQNAISNYNNYPYGKFQSVKSMFRILLGTFKYPLFYNRPKPPTPFKSIQQHNLLVHVIILVVFRLIFLDHYKFYNRIT